MRTAMITLYWRPFGTTPQIWAHCHISELINEGNGVYYRKNIYPTAWFKEIDGMYVLHRDNAPALVYDDIPGHFTQDQYYLNGAKLNKKEIENRQREKNLLKDMKCLSYLHE